MGATGEAVKTAVAVPVRPCPPPPASVIGRHVNGERCCKKPLQSYSPTQCRQKLKTCRFTG